MASACLPFMFQAVEIDGVPYWDGGYMGNPVIYPFYGACRSDDIVIVQINPVERKGTPRSAREILNRVNEITFNSSLLKELRAIDFVQRLLDNGKLGPDEYRRLHVHLIEAQDRIMPLGASSKLNAEWDFLRHLFEIGRDRDVGAPRHAHRTLADISSQVADPLEVRRDHLHRNGGAEVLGLGCLQGQQRQDALVDRDVERVDLEVVILDLSCEVVAPLHPFDVPREINGRPHGGRRRGIGHVVGHEGSVPGAAANI